MPNYEYSCSNSSCECDTFRTYQNIKDDPLTICPYCNEATIERIFHAVQVIVSSEPKTLGSLADANRKKFGHNYCDEQEARIRDERLSANEFVGSLPPGASVVKRQAKDTAWRKAKEPVDMSLAKMTKKQINEYLLTGKKPI